jgi:hypothetical protein
MRCRINLVQWRLLVLALVVGGCDDDAFPTAPDLAAGADLAAAPAPQGTLLVPGKGSVVGTTTDDFAVTSTPGTVKSTASLAAVPLAGGTAQPIDPAAQWLLVSGPVVFSWAGLDPSTSVGGLTVWSNAGGVHTLTAASTAGWAGATTDGTWVLFSSSSDGLTNDLSLARTDGSAAPMVVLSARSARFACPIHIVPAASRFFVTSCANLPDAGVAAADLHVIDAPTGSVTPLASNLEDAVGVDPTGTHAFVIDTNGNGQLLTVGGATLTVDAAVSEGAFTPDGAAVVYLAAGALKQHPIGGATVTVVGADANQLHTLSPDGTHALYSKTYDPFNGGGDLSLVALGPGATPTLLLADSAYLFGDGFTTDSSHALYFTDLQADETATLYARPTAGGAARTIAPMVWTEAAGPGALLVYNDHYGVGADNIARADLWWIDLSRDVAPALIAAQADANFVVSRSKKYVVYAVGDEGAFAFPFPTAP